MAKGKTQIRREIWRSRASSAIVNDTEGKGFDQKQGEHRVEHGVGKVKVVNMKGESHQWRHNQVATRDGREGGDLGRR